MPFFQWILGARLPARRLFAATLTLACLVALSAPFARANLAHGAPALPGASVAAAPDAGAARERERERDEDDKVAPDSPRAAYTDFVALARSEDYAGAVKYLELPRNLRGAGAATLAQHLDVVLRRRLVIDPETISPNSLGDTEDGLTTGFDDLGRIVSRTNPKGDPVRLVRRIGADGKLIWQFSYTTVEHIEGWYNGLEDRWLRSELPEFWFRAGPFDILYWQWIALPVLALFAFALSFLLTRLMRPLVDRALPSPLTGAEAANAEAANNRASYRARLRGPLHLAWAAGIVRLGMPWLALDLGAEDTIRGAIRTGFGFAVLWAALRVIDTSTTNVGTSAWGRAHPAGVGLVPLGAKLAKIALVAIGTVALLSELGFQVGSIVAGLGIGGLALALAAQKTIENLFGGVSIGMDQPFKIGDYINVDGIGGTVESLGLRSTRLRTPDRSRITIPNGKLAEMRIENVSARDRYRFNAVLPLKPNTPAATLGRIVTRLSSHVKEVAPTYPDDAYAELREYRKESTDLEVGAIFAVKDYNAYRAARLALNLMIARVIDEEGAAFTDPTGATKPPAPGGAAPSPSRS